VAAESQPPFSPEESIMAVRITHVRYSGNSPTHESIVAYRWQNHADNTTGDSDKPTMVNFIDNQHGQAFVGSGANQVAVGTVHPSGGQPYLRTYADRVWTNNLLALDTF
jgi:hypothetical protein